MADFNFGCTSCGKCCHDLRLPLTPREAIAWLMRGNGVIELLCEAIPWPEEPDPSNGLAAYKRRRSFAARSGDLPIRVIATLTAVYAGACPNLKADFRCNIYAERPHACRIYPAEINPFIAFSPANKLCPPEAWTASAPLLRDGEVVDAETRHQIVQLREEGVQQAHAMQMLCGKLGIAGAGLSNEGFAVHAPAAKQLLEALQGLHKQQDAEARPSWVIRSNQDNSVRVLRSVGAESRWVASSPAGSTGYIGFQADTIGNPVDVNPASSGHAADS